MWGLAFREKYKLIKRLRQSIMAGLLGDTGNMKLNNLKLRNIMTVKWNYFKFTLILHPIIYLTWSPKAREFPLVANNCSNNEKADGMWSQTWPDSECVLPTAVIILNIQRSARELKPVYTSLQLLLVQVRSLPNSQLQSINFLCSAFLYLSSTSSSQLGLSASLLHLWWEKPVKS